MKIDYGELKLTDLIDREILQKVQDGFANMTGMAALTTETDGTAVTEGSNFSDFCMRYTRGSKIGCEPGIGARRIRSLLLSCRPYGFCCADYG